MSEEELKKINLLDLADQATINEKVSSNIQDKTALKPSNQLSNGLLGWYSTCTSKALKDGQLYFFSMYNEPLVLYRDKDSIARCIKDLCPHRGSSFRDGDIKEGELVCPYHGARYSSTGECTNLDRITCSHIVDTNYDNYAKKIHLSQYPCIEKNGYIYIYYTGNAKTNLTEFEIKTPLEDTLVESYGFKTSEYEYEEVTVDFKADWARIIENHLDILHIFWVHGDTIPDKDVSRNVITSFNQVITRETRQIQSKYNHKIKSKGEFITIKFIPPGRVVIYKGDEETSRYVQVLDHIPLAENRARVIVRHYRRFMKNKVITSLFLFKNLQHRVFYKVFSEDYMILKTQSFNQQMGYVEKDNVKLLGEDKMVQYYWDWLQNALVKDKPWDIHPTSDHTNTLYKDMEMLYPPENPKLAINNKRSIYYKLALRLIIPITLALLIL